MFCLNTCPWNTWRINNSKPKAFFLMHWSIDEIKLNNNFKQLKFLFVFVVFTLEWGNCWNTYLLFIHIPNKDKQKHCVQMTQIDFKFPILVQTDELNDEHNSSFIDAPTGHFTHLFIMHPLSISSIFFFILILLSVLALILTRTELLRFTFKWAHVCTF